MRISRSLRGRALQAWADAWVAAGIITRDEFSEYAPTHAATPHPHPATATTQEYAESAAEKHAAEENSGENREEEVAARAHDPGHPHTHTHTRAGAGARVGEETTMPLPHPTPTGGTNPEDNDASHEYEWQPPHTREPYNGMTITDTTHLAGGPRPMHVIVAAGGTAHIHDMDTDYSATVEPGGRLYAYQQGGPDDDRSAGTIINHGGTVISTHPHQIIQTDGHTATDGGELLITGGTARVEDTYIDAGGTARRPQ